MPEVSTAGELLAYARTETCQAAKLIVSCY